MVQLSILAQLMSHDEGKDIFPKVQISIYNTFHVAPIIISIIIVIAKVHKFD